MMIRMETPRLFLFIMSILSRFDSFIIHPITEAVLDRRGIIKGIADSCSRRTQRRD